MVTAIDIPLGPLDAGAFIVKRSGLRWLVPDGHHCRAGEVVAFCNVGLARRPGMPRPNAMPFAGEDMDLQVTLAPNLSGALHQRPMASRGGDLDQLHFFQNWQDDQVLAALEPDTEPAAPAPAPAPAPAWVLGFVAGRRMTELAEDRSGLLTGWHNRARAWHGEHGDHATVLSLGICVQKGIFRGDDNAFQDMLHDSPDHLHIVDIPDEALVPCSAVLIDQLQRDAAANAGDMARGMLSGWVVPTPADWIFAGCALAALTGNPLAERYDLLSRQGLGQAVMPKAVILSIHSEATAVLRHRKLGYRAFWHSFRINSAGPAVRDWLTTNFEKITRSVEDIRHDLLTLRGLLAGLGVEHMLIFNAMSSSGHEDIFSYAAFDGPLGDSLKTVRAKEFNVMLHDLSETSDIAVIDVDAIATQLGGGAHVPDGVHQSRALQQALRREVLHILTERGLLCARR